MARHIRGIQKKKKKKKKNRRKRVSLKESIVNVHIIKFFNMFFSLINLSLECYLSILYFKNVITENIFEMFRTFRIHLLGTLSNFFSLVNPSRT